MFSCHFDLCWWSRGVLFAWWWWQGGVIIIIHCVCVCVCLHACLTEAYCLVFGVQGQLLHMCKQLLCRVLRCPINGVLKTCKRVMRNQLGVCPASPPNPPQLSQPAGPFSGRVALGGVASVLNVGVGAPALVVACVREEERGKRQQTRVASAGSMAARWKVSTLPDSLLNAKPRSQQAEVGHQACRVPDRQRLSCHPPPYSPGPPLVTMPP